MTDRSGGPQTALAPGPRKGSWLPKIQAKLTEQQVDRLLGLVERIAEARIQAGLADAAATQQIRLLQAKLRDDSARCAMAATHLEELGHHLSEAERGELAAAIIKLQLGVPAGGL